MKKIIIITDVWYPQVNGVMTILEKTIELLKKKDFVVIVIQPGLFTTIPMPFYSEIRTPLFSRNRIKKIFNKEKPDYIHIVTEGMLGLNTRLICKKYNLKFTTSYHTHFPEYLKIRSGTGLFYNSVYKYLQWFHNGGEKTMVATEDLKNELKDRGFSDLVIWPCAVDTDFFVKDKNNAFNINFQKPIFFYLGRVAEEKNIEEYLKCPLPGTKLVIGDGPERKELEKKYAGEAIFIGYKKGKELVDLISLCDVMVFPSRTDTFGLTIIEAMSCGIPVAAHSVMGPKDIISSGIDGFLGEDLLKAATSCLTLSGADCRNKALKYTWDNSVESFITNLIKTKSS